MSLPGGPRCRAFACLLLRGPRNAREGARRAAPRGPALPDPTPFAATLEPVAAHTFRLESKDGFSSHGELVVFELDPNGKVARITIGPNSLLPVEAW